MSLSDHTLVFGGAGEREMPAIGRFVRIREASSSVFIRVEGGLELKRQAGEQIDLGVHRKRFYVRSAVAQTIELTVAEDRQDDNRAAVSVNTTTTIDPSNNLAGVAAKSCPSAGSVQLVAGNASRVRMIIKVPTDQPDGVWIDGSASVVDNGYFLEPGETIILGTVAEVWAYGNGGGLGVTVSVLEEEIL